VSHHPPISACYAFSDDYEYFMNTNTKMAFNGTHIKATPLGYQHVTLKGYDEHYVIERPLTYVNNIIIGKMYVEHSGHMIVRNLKNGMVAKIEYKPAGWTKKNLHQLEGLVYLNSDDMEARVRPYFQIKGSYMSTLTAYPLEVTDKKDNVIVDDEKLPLEIWKVIELPDNEDWNYHFTQFAMMLNNLPEELEKKLPPTDCRLRPDLKALELGNFELAAVHKNRLEEKQRAMR